MDKHEHSGCMWTPTYKHVCVNGVTLVTTLFTFVRKGKLCASANIHY